MQESQLETSEGATDLDAVEATTEGDDLLVDPLGRVIIEKNDRSLAEFHRWHREGRLIIDPEWQRNYVWDSKRASRLIESVLMDIPVPVIYLARNEDGRYEVIDGLQRLTSIFRFFDNESALSGLQIAAAQNGKRFRDLTEREKNKLQDTTFRTFELSPRTPKDLMFVIFERLNTGGVGLNEMEIRNCLFRGKLNDLLKHLAQNDDFKTCLGQNNIAKRMLDRALVLRFLAFYERTYLKARVGLQRFIHEFFETYRNPTEQKLDEYEKQFAKVMKASLTIFGSQGFRLKNGLKSQGASTGEWASKFNAAIFQVIAASFTPYDLSQLTRASDAIYEEYLDLILTDANWVDFVRRATGEVTRLTYVFETWETRLKAVMSTYPVNDKTRCFSRALKMELFHQNQTCTLCGQQIVLIDDAAIDHIEHYWRGVETIPENARLCHRFCNSSRGGHSKM